MFQPSFDDLSTPLFEVSFCVLDLETTGGSPRDCEITEIGAVKYRGGEEIGSFQTLVNPGLPIPPTITILTGITESMVYEAPRIEDVLPSFLEFIADCVIVGHNVRFDLSFLNAASVRFGYPRLPNKSVDTAALARRLIRSEVRNLKLQTLAKHFRSPVKPVHRALEDAQATAHVLHGLLERVGSLGVTNLDDLLQLPTARGSQHYSKIKLTEALPRRPGVYIFKDSDGHPIYVGKATNLRARVRHYFYGDKRRTVANMMRELASVEHTECPTVLEAEITELRLIHAYRPRYNRRSRPPKNSHYVKVTKEKYPRLSVVRTLRDDALAYLGPFRSKRSADLVVHALWDAVPIRRCRTRPASRKGKCADAQLGVATCPCDGTLPSADYTSIVARLISGLTEDPNILLSPLADRMARLSNEQRYEEAAWVRDRHNALVLSIDRRNRWQSLMNAGFFEAEDSSGAIFVVDHGSLVETRAAGSQRGILPNQTTSETTGHDVAPSVQHGEEADTIWRWLETGSPRILSATGYLALPRVAANRLEVRKRAAA